MRTSFGLEGNGSGWTLRVQVKLWNPLSMRAIPERLKDVFTTIRYTNPRLPLPYLTWQEKLVSGRGVESESDPRSLGFGPESESLIWRRLRLRALSVSSGLLCNFVAVYLNYVPFILQLKLCLYTNVHLLLEEIKNFPQVILKYTISMSHSKS